MKFFWHYWQNHKLKRPIVVVVGWLLILLMLAGVSGFLVHWSLNKNSNSSKNNDSTITFLTTTNLDQLFKAEIIQTDINKALQITPTGYKLNQSIFEYYVLFDLFDNLNHLLIKTTLTTDFNFYNSPSLISALVKIKIDYLNFHHTTSLYYNWDIKPSWLIKKF